MTQPNARTRHPAVPVWLRKRVAAGSDSSGVSDMLRELGLSTVCSGARCPNLPECFARRTATFMILGERCSRHCAFCAVPSREPGVALSPPDPDEPAHVAEASARLELRHVVITSVTRDDLPDGGASHFARTIESVRRRLPEATIEVLTPDFQGDARALEIVLSARPDVFNHNIETVPRLYPIVRPQANYARSLEVLRRAREYADTCSLASESDEFAERARARSPGFSLLFRHPEQAEGWTTNSSIRRPPLRTKSGLMVGLGETSEEVVQTLRDLRAAGCEILTIGQYLAPTPAHLPVARYVEPAEYDTWRDQAKALGFIAVAAGPFVRSSYRAEEILECGDVAF